MPDVLMPRLSDTMTEGTLVQWLKHVGDQVHRGDALAEVETDKATMDVEAYDNGILTRILVEAGSVVPIGNPIAVIGEQSTATAEPATLVPAVTGTGPGLPAQVQLYRGTTLLANPFGPTPDQTLDPYNTVLTEGVYVG